MGTAAMDDAATASTNYFALKNPDVGGWSRLVGEG
jgi:hypothetical protein